MTECVLVPGDVLPLHAHQSSDQSSCLLSLHIMDEVRWALQIPSQLVAERVGLPYWIGFLMVGWGITATLMAGLTSSPTHLYLLRFFLGQLASSALIVPFHAEHVQQRTP